MPILQVRIQPGAFSRKRRPFYFLLGIFPLIFSALGCDLPFNLPLGNIFRSTAQRTEIMPGQLLTLDGLDSGTGILVLRIPLRKEPTGSSTAVIATGNHGDPVKFVQRDAENILVETWDGKRAWVASYFIKELK